jgi:ubiquinone/menaquinone biosynthesis C-methylase UbiE
MMRNFSFKVMALLFRLRDFFMTPVKKLEEAGLKPGFRVLDFGCGPGSFSEAAADKVGPSGKVYSLDIHPLAIQSIKKRIERKGIRNIESISSDGDTGLSDASIDVVLLYDVLHEIKEKHGVLFELNRVLKPGGIVSLSDHHLKEKEILSHMTGQRLFVLERKDKKTYAFSKLRRRLGEGSQI